jgi:hypothetical protein
MVIKNIPACAHKIVKYLPVLARRKIFLYRLTENVVRAHEIVCVASTLPKNAVAVADSGVEVLKLITHLRLQRLYELIRFGSRYFVRTVVYHYFFFVRNPPIT